MKGSMWTINEADTSTMAGFFGFVADIETWERPLPERVEVGGADVDLVEELVHIYMWTKSSILKGLVLPDRAITLMREVRLIILEHSGWDIDERERRSYLGLTEAGAWDWQQNHLNRARAVAEHLRDETLFEDSQPEDDESADSDDRGFGYDDNDDDDIYNPFDYDFTGLVFAEVCLGIPDVISLDGAVGIYDEELSFDELIGSIGRSMFERLVDTQAFKLAEEERARDLARQAHHEALEAAARAEREVEQQRLANKLFWELTESHHKQVEELERLFPRDVREDLISCLEGQEFEVMLADPQAMDLAVTRAISTAILIYNEGVDEEWRWREGWRPWLMTAAQGVALARRARLSGDIERAKSYEDTIDFMLKGARIDSYACLGTITTKWLDLMELLKEREG